MIDLSLSGEHKLITVFIILYLILISIYTSKFHKSLSKIKKFSNQFKFKKITKVFYTESVHSERIKINKLKKNSYIVFITCGCFHLVLAYYFSFSIIPPLVVFILMFLILLLNYWMKGASVTGSLKNLPSTSDVRPL